MNDFQRKVLGFPGKGPPPPIEECRPDDLQLKATIQTCREARFEGVTLRFQPNDIQALCEELLEHRQAFRESLDALRLPPPEATT